MLAIGSVVVLVGSDLGSRPYTTLIACFASFQWLSLVVLPLIQVSIYLNKIFSEIFKGFYFYFNLKGAKLSNSLKKVRELGHIVRKYKIVHIFGQYCNAEFVYLCIYV